MLALRINEILKEQNKSQYWLSKQTGIAPNNISKICKGETVNIRFDTLEKICIALDCSLNDLFVTNNPRAKRLLYYNALITEIHNPTDDFE